MRRFAIFVYYSMEGLAIFLAPFLLLFRWAFILARKIGSWKPISIWTGAPIICMAKNCKAERLLGYDARTVVSGTYFITEEFDYNLSHWNKNSGGILLALQYAAFFVMCIAAKRVHAYVDGGILPSLRRRSFNRIELALYRILGVELIIWTYGADVRYREGTEKLGVPNCCVDCPSVGTACICETALWKENYTRVSTHATAVFSMGDMIEYTPGSRNDLFFWPVDLKAKDGERYQPAYPNGEKGTPLQVVHAPNHREFKGSRYLIETVAELQAEGFPIELVLVEKRSNTEALEIYRGADVIFDQCLIGFHGYFALEAMALGKPVMCFIRKPNEYLLHAEECPFINCHVTTLKADFLRLIEQRDELAEIGRKGRAYIEKYFSLEAFADRLARAYRDLKIAR